MIPDRLLKILRSCESSTKTHFPQTEIYNEGWMLRLLLDAAQETGLRHHSLEFLPGARWYSEARLNSPFLPRTRGDSLAEGFTHADGIIGHFEIAQSTSAGIRLSPTATQFVVVEAKMFSNLSKGTTRAPLYDQAARNVGCIAETVARSALTIDRFERIGFFVIAPAKEKRGRVDSNLETCVTGASVKAAIESRIAMYEAALRPESKELRAWKEGFLHPLMERMSTGAELAVLSWEQCIADISARDATIGGQLSEFYERCLSYGPGTGSIPPSP